MPAQRKEPGQPTGVGRPRSEESRRLVLSTTIKLLQKQTVQTLTIEAIAREAGVSKATIYRWWSSKASIVIDAFMENHVIKTPMPRDVPPREAIAKHFVTLVAQFSGWTGRIIAQIIAEGQFDPQIAREFRERFHYGRRAVVREVLEDWRRSGEINPAINVEELMEVIYAPVYMRLLVGHGPLDEDFARSHLTFVYALLGVGKPAFSDKEAANPPG